MRDIIAMVLAGGRVEELSALTQSRPKAAVPFGAQYRIIDFALSSLLRADLERIGVLSLYRPSSLIDHLGTGEPWDLTGRGRGIKILPPSMAGVETQWYRGTADAVFQNLDFIQNSGARDVLILSGDHIHNIDLRHLIDTHRGRDADLTMMVKEMDPESGRGRFGFAEVDDDQRVVGYEEKPDRPASNLVSLTVYLFKTDVLISRLAQNTRLGESYQLYDEILPAMVAEDRVYACPYEGYWNYTRSVDAYLKANLDLLGEPPPIQLADWGVRSRRSLRGIGDLPPARFEAGAQCYDSVIASGVHLAGRVERSVVSPCVQIEPGAIVTDSVILHDTLIRSGARVDRTVVDKSVVIGRDARVGQGADCPPNLEVPDALFDGVSLVGKGARIPDGATIGRNCVVEPHVIAEDWQDLELSCGMSLMPGPERSDR